MGGSPRSIAARPSDKSAWLTAATAVTAYRERYEVPEHTPMLGRRPAASRPDAQAAWDHACLQADRYLARHLRDLDAKQLTDLDARQQTTLNKAPPFDPSELERARQGPDGAHRSLGGRIAASGDGIATTREQLMVHRLQRAAQAHRAWRRASTEAEALRSQIADQLQQRRGHLSVRRPAVRSAG